MEINSKRLKVMANRKNVLDRFYNIQSVVLNFTYIQIVVYDKYIYNIYKYTYNIYKNNAIF